MDVLKGGGSYCSTSTGYGDMACGDLGGSLAGVSQWSSPSASLFSGRPQTSGCLGSRGLLTPIRHPLRKARRRPGTSEGCQSSVDWLGGLSMSTEVQNVFCEVAMESMGDPVSQLSPESPKGSRKDRRIPTITSQNGDMDLDPQNFLASLDAVTSSIEEGRKFHDGFSGQKGNQDPGSPKGKKDKSSSPSHRVREEEARRRERFEAFKMTRKIEPDLPPLQPLKEEECSEEFIRDQTIVKRNAAPDAIACWSIARRKEDISRRKQERTSRLTTAASARTLHMNKLQQEWADDLFRKQKQGQLALTRKKKLKTTEAIAEEENPVRMWLAWLCAFNFTHLLKEKMGKIEQLRKESRASNAMKLRKAVHKIVLAQKMNRGDPKAGSGEGLDFSALGFAMQTEHAKNEECKSDKMRLANTFTEWKRMTKGKCRHIEMIQETWRNWALWNNENVETLSKHWWTIERNGITLEHRKSVTRAARESHQTGNFPQKGHTPSRKTASPLVPLSLLTLEEKIEFSRMPVEDRERFIRHELRALRYHLLPRISVWEEEVRDWNIRLEEQRQEREATKTMFETAELEAFYWPPIKPTYIPKVGKGAEGDEILIEWVRKAKKNPQGWTQIKTYEVGRRATKDKFDKKKKDGYIDEETSPFGEVATDEDLKKWGLDLRSMPCLQDEVSEGEVTPRGRTTTSTTTDQPLAATASPPMAARAGGRPSRLDGLDG